jgi:hypothetical protein
MSEALTIAPTCGDSFRKPGDALELLAQWSLTSIPKSLEVRLFWFTRGTGTEDVGIVATEVVPATGADGSHRVTFTLPEAPYSFSGQLVSLIWAVELVAGKKVARWEFVLAPEGQAIVLPYLNYPVAPDVSSSE